MWVHNYILLIRYTCQWIQTLNWSQVCTKSGAMESSSPVKSIVIWRQSSQGSRDWVLIASYKVQYCGSCGTNCNIYYTVMMAAESSGGFIMRSLKLISLVLSLCVPFHPNELPNFYELPNFLLINHFSVQITQRCFQIYITSIIYKCSGFLFSFDLCCLNFSIWK